MDRRVIGERSDAVLRTAMPGDDTAIVARDARQWGKALVFLAKTARDELFQRISRGTRLVAGRRNGDLGADAGAEHHEAHDRAAADRLLAARHAHVGIEAFCGLAELRRGAGVQSLL